jgi:hypothetical protein
VITEENFKTKLYILVFTGNGDKVKPGIPINPSFVIAKNN